MHLCVCSRTLCPEKTTKIMYKASFHSYTHPPHSEPIFQREKPKTKTSTQPVCVSLPLFFCLFPFTPRTPPSAWKRWGVVRGLSDVLVTAYSGETRDRVAQPCVWLLSEVLQSTEALLHRETAKTLLYSRSWGGSSTQRSSPETVLCLSLTLASMWPSENLIYGRLFRSICPGFAQTLLPWGCDLYYLGED